MPTNPFEPPKEVKLDEELERLEVPDAVLKGRMSRFAKRSFSQSKCESCGDLAINRLSERTCLPPIWASALPL
jgi:hypothetical protein